MTAKARPPSTPKSRKALVPQCKSEIDDRLVNNCMDVTIKLKSALKNARSGITEGAVIIALDHQGYWSVDRAGKLMDDDDTLFLIAGRMFGACLMSK